MKKTISALIILLMFLVPVGGGASYLLRLKNGGQLVTPAYWTEGKWVIFFCAGGTAGMERKDIDRIETLKTEDGEDIDKTSTRKAEKAREPEKPPEAKEEKVDLNAYKDKKTQMTVELDTLLEKQREAAGRGDNEAKEKIMEEIRNTSTQIYRLTDEVTEKNKGKLPDGWWEK